MRLPKLIDASVSLHDDSIQVTIKPEHGGMGWYYTFFIHTNGKVSAVPPLVNNIPDLIAEIKRHLSTLEVFAEWANMTNGG